MKTLWIAGGLLLAACLAACNDDSEMQAQSARAETTIEQRDVVSNLRQQSEVARPQSTSPSGNQTREQQQQTETQQPELEEGASRVEESEADAIDEDDSADAQEPAPQGATELPAAVVATDADMRVRPGLPWRAIRRLAAGDEVEVLSRTGGWLRIRIDDCEGWIRSPALDLGDVDENNILEEAPPPIIAEWQGVEYGVMGQSADAAEVRLLGDSEEIVSAPKSEVTLLTSDITVEDLPVLIGDETVVFPGDDFRAGQGKILPRADEWMWLPWGWLLAHNDEYIWQWRPETDELEFIRRPEGFAKLSPDGRFLAIAECVLGVHGAQCPFNSDVLIMPLDGAPVVRVREALQDVSAGIHFSVTDGTMHSFADEPLQWSSDSSALLVRLELNGWFMGAASITPTGAVSLFGYWSPDAGVGENCGFDDFDWHLFSDNTVSASGWCTDESTGASHTVWHRFSTAGEFLRTTRLNWSGESWSQTQSRIRLADTDGDLSERFSHHFSPDQSLALVVSQDAEADEPLTLWLYRHLEGALIPIKIDRHETMEGAPGWPGFRSVTFWHGNKRVVVQQVGSIGWNLGAVIVDTDEARSDEIEAVEFRRSHYVYLDGAWDPAGKLFRTFTPQEDSAGNPEGAFGIDGLHSTDGGSHLLLISEIGGALEAVILTEGDRDAFAGPKHRADWSEQGEWFVLGGEHRRTPLYGH